MRFEVRALKNGEGWVIVDTAWKLTMIGPFSRRKRAAAEARAEELEVEHRAKAN